MKPGSKSLPTNLHILRGNPGKRPLNRREPQPRIDKVQCPRWLSPEAKKCWQKHAPELKRLGLLTCLDVNSFAMFCESFATWKRAALFIQENGITYTAGSGLEKIHPAVKIADDYAKLTLRFATEFGLTPSARTQLKAEPSSQMDDLDLFLNGRKKS